MASRYLRLFFRELVGFITHCIIAYPNTHLGLALRRRYYKWLLRGKLGQNATIYNGVIIYSDAYMEIGENFSAGHNVIIDPNDSFGIIIGNNVGIASGTFIRAANHGYSDPDMPFKEQGHIARKLVSCDGCEASIIIEDDVWIGANSTILSGAHIKKGSIVSAGSVTSFKLPEYSIAVGNPARVIASRRNTNFSKKNYRFK